MRDIAADSEHLAVAERPRRAGRESWERSPEREGPVRSGEGPSDANGEGRERPGQEAHAFGSTSLGIDWGKYEPAIRRWEAITGRPAPSPTEFGPRGNIRLSARFAEWMMGVPPGWITDMGFPRKDMFRLIGNGVVPLQAALAIRGLVNEES